MHQPNFLWEEKSAADLDYRKSPVAMRAVVQRVLRASVDVDGALVSSTGPGLMVLVGLHVEDTFEDAQWLAGKLLNARVFPDETGKDWTQSVTAECEPARQILFVSLSRIHICSCRRT